MLQLLSDPEAWVAFLTLTMLEIVLGIDNIVFIAILTARLPDKKQHIAYRVGLMGAMVMRLLLLLVISWVMGLTETLFTILKQDISGRDIILIAGGLFLIGKSAHEIYGKMELKDDGVDPESANKSNLASIIVQIMLLDVVFSLDSVITAVGMVDEIAIMVAAIIVAILIMLIFAERIGNFVNANPSIKVLALSFLLLIGVLLTAEGFDQHINKGYIYFAMGYALVVELINMRWRKKSARQESTNTGAS